MAIALFVLWGLRPWESNSADPHEVPLGIETAVGGGKALPVPSTAHVGAGVAVPAGPGIQAAQKASGDAGPSPSPSPAPSPSDVAVVPARAVAVTEAPSSPAGPAPGSGAGEEVPSAGTTAGEVPSEGTSSPVAAPAGTPGGGTSKAPVTAGVTPPTFESCEGDEYVITVAFLDGESTVEEAPVEIVLAKLNEDGTTDELQLEGDLSDVHALASTLEAEGNCVTVEIAQPEGEGAEAEEPGASGEGPKSGEEAPESGEGAVEPAEALVPSSP
ncbi:MAG TPA: hypothetical protein VNS60_02000 [Solirubrobacterales bacterium]|nr:hypothetical protein [Solirubrobacterales bacterium]